MIKTYKSKISLGLFLFVNVPLIALVVFPFLSDRGNELNVTVLLVILPILLFINYTLFSNRYTINENKLEINGGVLYRLSIDISQIKKIEKSNSIWSSPAASLDRLEILYNKWDSVLISPEDKEDFVFQLKQINPDIIVKL